MFFGKTFVNHRVFPAICKYYRVSPQHTQSFPLRSIGFLCAFPLILQEKPTDMTRNHLHCRKLLFLYCNWKQSSKPQSQKYGIGRLQFHTLQSCTGPVQGQNRVFPVKFSTQGKTCFHYREPLFSLQGPLFSLQGFPCEKTSQGKPCFHYREWVCSVSKWH